ncbi:MAG TPA: EAL domain-containing protein, partial [Bacillota bacterium]|nr:EAL domain-containing protein [Bacillota bacterium]
FENKVNQYSFDDYQVYLQPIVNTETNEVYGFEGLTRLFDKSNKPLNTIDVIKVLERQGKIPELDMHVFDTVTQYAKQLKQRFKKDYYFSFNVSPVTLSEDFVTYLADKVKAEHLDPTHFIFEIIETIGFKNIDESVSLLQKLRNIGFQIAMDDFGMGYSSLSYIAKLPLSVIKIDRYFINNYYDNEFDRLLIFAIKDISKSLNLKIVVEGIETTRQLEFIKSLGAHYYQGYFHSRPMSIKDLMIKLDKGFE